MREYSIWIRLTLAGVIGRGFVVKMVDGQHLSVDRDKTRIDWAASAVGSGCGTSPVAVGSRVARLHPLTLSPAILFASPPSPRPRFSASRVGTPYAAVFPLPILNASPSFRPHSILISPLFSRPWPLVCQSTPSTAHLTRPRPPAFQRFGTHREALAAALAI